MLDVAVIGDPAAAEVSLDPVRARLLGELAEPASANMAAPCVERVFEYSRHRPAVHRALDKKSCPD